MRRFFDEKLFPNKTFDFVVAHGFINRSATLPELIKIGHICNDGAFLSLELLLMENSLFSPYIWDHSFMFPQCIFEFYLSHAGFTPVKITNCGSSFHYLCKKTERAKEIETLHIPESLIEKVEQMFANHLAWWKNVNNNLTVSLHHASDHLALFGAGLYSAVLFSFVSPKRFTCAIDEIKTGKKFFDLPVISIEDARKIKPTVLLCSRPEYFSTIRKKLESNDIPFIRLNP